MFLNLVLPKQNFFWSKHNVYAQKNQISYSSIIRQNQKQNTTFHVCDGYVISIMLKNNQN